ncbi:MAG TPA: efflux RND transporter periplasmic adaptor subunit [Methylomirabilota bacterium]|nr:efflux RND transporter periplasmic adaptor subunit [Methylomirabilota bacterium]
MKSFPFHVFWAPQLSLLIVASGLFCSCSRGSSQERAAPGALTEQTLTITTKPVEVRALKRTVEMVGTLNGWEEVTISNEMPGTIEKILVDLGDRVKRGQLLIRFDQREARLALAQAEANLEAGKKALAQAQAEWRDADLTLKRIKQLHNEGVIATSQLDVAQSRFDAVEAQVRAREADLDRFRALVDLAKKKVSDTEIVAPIGGEVRQRLVSIGETIKDKTPMLRLVITDPLKFQGTVPERFAPDIKIEQPVDVQVEAFADKTFPGVIHRVSPAVDVQTRSLALEARVPNPDRLLKPGFFAKGLIVIGVNPQAVFAPEEAVYSYVGITKAFVVRDSVAHERQVKIGVRKEGWVEIIDGLQAGDVVATSGLPQLYQGARVSVVNGKS